MGKGEGRRSKRDKPDPLIRDILASNVLVLRDRHFESCSSVTAKNRALAVAADTTISQIQRILSSELGTSLDLLARLSRALRCRPQDLLTPYFGSGPGHDGQPGTPTPPKFRMRQTQTQKTSSTTGDSVNPQF